MQGDQHALHHVLANAERSVEELCAIRLPLTVEALTGRPVVLCLDKTGEATGCRATPLTLRCPSTWEGCTGSSRSVSPSLPLGCSTRSRFHSPSPWRNPRPASSPVTSSRPSLSFALALIEQLLAHGYRFAVVLADTVSGEHATCLNAQHQLGLRSVVAIRSTHGIWMEANQRIRIIASFLNSGMECVGEEGEGGVLCPNTLPLAHPFMPAKSNTSAT